jgi:hypothetical protein
VDVGNREVNTMVMMPPLPPLPMLDSSRWAEQMQDYAIAYGRAVAEACAVILDNKSAALARQGDLAESEEMSVHLKAAAFSFMERAAAIREMAVEEGK